MKKTGRKKIFGMAAAVLVCVAFAGSAVHASSGCRRDAISSRGAINYDRGRVVMDSADLIGLAAAMDKTDTGLKTDIAEALAEVRSYVQQDGSVRHEGSAQIDPQQLAFGYLITGILQSQSVAHLDDTQAADGNRLLYYKSDKRNLLEVTTDNTGIPLYIVPATDDNLTAQTAARVDGHCLVGNGSDNRYFYKKGFIEGYAAETGAKVEYKYDETGKIESAELIFP